MREQIQVMEHIKAHARFTTLHIAVEQRRARAPLASQWSGCCGSAINLDRIMLLVRSLSIVAASDAEQSVWGQETSFSFTFTRPCSFKPRARGQSLSCTCCLPMTHTTTVHRRSKLSVFSFWSASCPKHFLLSLRGVGFKAPLLFNDRDPFVDNSMRRPVHDAMSYS